jgi:phage gpG-like protein
MYPYVRFIQEKPSERARTFRVTIEDIKERLQSRQMKLIVGEEIVRIVKKNILVGGRPEKFKPLAPSTILARRRRGNYSKKPLIDTGKMLESIQADYRGGKLQLKMVRYAEYANNARKFIVIPPEERPNLKKAIQRALKLSGK